MGKFKEGESSVPKDASRGLPMGMSEKKGKTAEGLSKVKSAGTATSKDKIDLVHLEDVQETKIKPTKKQKFQRHCKRFWFCYLIGLIVLLAIGLPVLFLEILPAVAQLIVNKTALPISDTILKAISDDQVIVGLSTALSIPGGLTVKLDPVDLYLYNKDTPKFSPYVMVPLDAQTIHGKTAIKVPEQAVDVGDRNELNKWLNDMLYSKRTDISVKGHTTAHLGALHFGLDLIKTVNIAALNELSGFSLVDSTLKLPGEKDGTNLVGNLTLPNWSDLTIGLGNLTFNAWAGEYLVGSVTAYDVLLPPGNSTLPFRGELFIDTLMSNLIAIVGTQGTAITEGMLELAVSGNKTIVDGQHITYLERVLNAAHITSRIPILQLLSDLLASVQNGDITLNGISDVLGGSLGPILDNLLGNTTSSSGDSSKPDLGDEIFGNGTSSDKGILGDLLDKLDMKDGNAKKRFIAAMIDANVK